MKSKCRPGRTRPEHEFGVQVATLVGLYGWIANPSGVFHIAVYGERSSSFPFNEPSEELLLALFDHNIDARTNAEMPKTGNFFVDPVTGTDAYLLGVQSIEWVGENEARVNCLFLNGIRAGLTFRSCLSWDGVEWKVMSMNSTGMF